jgi:ADP-sugar diphosphatase
LTLTLSVIDKLKKLKISGFSAVAMDAIETACKQCVAQQSGGSETASTLTALLPAGFKLVYEGEANVRTEVVQEGDAPVPITGEPGVNIQTCLDANIYQDWKAHLSNTFLVRGVHFQSLDMFGPRVGFIKMNADIVTREGAKFVPGITLLRGGAVAILIIITCEGKDYVVLTAQPRAPVSISDLLELPAGMLDGSGNFAGVAAKEIKEETGLDIKLEDLINLSEMAWGGAEGKKPMGNSPLENTRTPRGMYPSAGGCDEFITLFLHRTAMTRPQLSELEGKLTGNMAEGEMITLKVIEYEHLWRVADSKALSAAAVYQGLQSLPEFAAVLPEPNAYSPAAMDCK